MEENSLNKILFNYVYHKIMNSSNSCFQLILKEVNTKTITLNILMRRYNYLIKIDNK
jgi:hypothetical protein